MFFCKSETSAPHGKIDLSACLTVKSADLKTKKRFSIEISTARETYFVMADSEREKDEWIGAIGRAIVQSSTTFTHEDGKDGSESEDD